MTLGQLAKRALGVLGIKAYSWKNLLWGISLERDLQRIFENNDSPTLFDVGANVGQTARRFRAALPNALIYCFEPIGATFAELEMTAKRLGNVRPYRFAMGASCGLASMAVVENSEQNRLLADDFEGDLQIETVEIYTVDSFMAKNGITRLELLKTDCEGFDFEVIVGAEQAIAAGRIDAILSEVTLQRRSMHTDFLAVHAHLLDRGFYFFAFYDYGGWGRFHSQGQFLNALWLRDQARSTPSGLS